MGGKSILAGKITRLRAGLSMRTGEALAAVAARPAFVVLAIGLLASVLLNWPGHFPPDAVWQLSQGRTGVYDSWHPPVMAWLLGVADRLYRGGALFIVLEAGLFFAALAAFVALRPRTGALGLAGLALMVASPLVLIYQGEVLKDVLFADAALAGFAALAWSSRLDGRRRWGLIGAALLCMTLATLARQNGLIVGLTGAMTLGAMAFVRSRGVSGAALRTAALSGLAWAAAAAATLGVAAGAASWALELRGDHEPQAARELAALQIYDLIGAVHYEPGLALPVLHRRAPALEAFVRRAAPRAYSPTRIDTLDAVPGAEDLLHPDSPLPGAQWRGLIAGSPLLYARVRAGVFGWILLTPDVRRCAPVFAGIDRTSDPDLLRSAGLAPRWTAKDAWDSRYAWAFLGTPVFSHLTYGLLALILLGLAVRDLRRGGPPELIAVVGLLTAALAFAASFAVIGISCDYRYLYFLDTAAMAALAHRLIGLGGPWRLDRLPFPRARRG